MAEYQGISYNTGTTADKLVNLITSGGSPEEIDKITETISNPSSPAGRISDLYYQSKLNTSGGSTSTTSGTSNVATNTTLTNTGGTVTSGSSVTSGIPTTEGAIERNEEVSQVISQTLTDPMVFLKQEIPAALQTSEDIRIKGTEVLSSTDPRFQVSEGQRTATATAGAAAPVREDFASVEEYNAALARHATMQAAQGRVSEGALVEAAQGDLTQLAQAATGRVDPKDLAQAAQGEVTQRVTAATGEAAQADIDAAIATAAIKDVSQEELVSYQMEQLTKGLESGDIPIWARPAVDAVEGQLAARGLSRSSVGQASLTNAIIQAAMPMAQQNAQTYFQRTESNLNREQAVNLQNAQSRLQLTTANLNAEQQMRIANMTNEQQAALANAQNQLSMDLANLTAAQETALSNSKYMQTMSLTNLNNRQQAAILNAQQMASMDMANLDARQQAQVMNAQSFLQMDMSNLSNRQQAALTNAQMKQQSLLSNQAAVNAARQFNATSVNQRNQFMSNLAATVDMNNAARLDAMRQFNAGQVNATRQFDSQMNLAREQFNAQNSTAIAQSNVQWRRQVNQINTAAQNAVNQANAMNAFNLSNQALTFMWQELRDAAKWSFEASENDQQRAAALAQAALGNESVTDAKRVGYISAIGKAALNFWLENRS